MWNFRGLVNEGRGMFVVAIVGGIALGVLLYFSRYG